jgi:hypothetical protein
VGIIHLTPPKARIEKGWLYDSAESSALELEALLKKHGVLIRAGSAFEQHVLSVLHMVGEKKVGRIDPQEQDIRPLYRTLIGVHEFASLLLSVQDNPSFSVLIPHLRLLNEGEVLQNSPSIGTDQATNKLFELYMGAVAMQCGDNLELDDPISSTGDNPDVLITIGRRRWGIACKVLHGKSPQGFIDNLEKGLDQIDRSAADVGIVIFNLKNILPHDRIWPLAHLDGIAGNPLTAAVWPDPSTPFQLLVYHMQRLGVELASYLPSSHLDIVFRNRKSLPGFLLWGASPSAAIINGLPTPASVRAMNFQTARQVSRSDKKVLECLNWAIYADSLERGPRPNL